MNELDTYNLKPAWRLYHILIEDLEEIFVDLIERKTDVMPHLYVDCLDSPHDLYVQFEDDGETHTPDEWEKLSALGLHPQEDFMNRDALLSHLFGVTYAITEYAHDTGVVLVYISASEDDAYDTNEAS